MSADDLKQGRVLRAEKGGCLVGLGEAEVHCAILPALHGAGERPVTGDYVEVDSENVIREVGKRRTLLSRKAAGKEAVGQPMAANVDTAFLVTSLDEDFSVRRLERYVALCLESGVDPVVVITKIDLGGDLAGCVDEVQMAWPAMNVMAVNALEGDGVDAVRAALPEGKTGVLLGSSGVGKSTLLNTLLGEARMRTNAVREDDHKGRHTTTHRELVETEWGAFFIDSPGMREVGLWAGEEAVDDTFAEIAALAGQCRFGDCTHDNEPGCAVRRAVEEGLIASARLESYHHLKREITATAIRKSEHERRKLEKKTYGKWRKEYQKRGDKRR